MDLIDQRRELFRAGVIALEKNNSAGTAGPEPFGNSARKRRAFEGVENPLAERLASGKAGGLIIRKSFGSLLRGGWRSISVPRLSTTASREA